jgi:hypothetical protein
MSQNCQVIVNLLRINKFQDSVEGQRSICQIGAAELRQSGEAHAGMPDIIPTPPPSAERIRFLVLQKRMLRRADWNLGSEGALGISSSRGALS